MNERIFRLLVKKISNELNFLQGLGVNLLLLFSSRVRKEYRLLKHSWHAVEAYNPHKVNYKPYGYDSSPDALAIFKLAIAASVILFVLLYTFVHPKTYIVQNDSGAPKTVVLPDNSQIILDTNATLVYHVSKIAGFDRKVRFIGRGYFEVAKHNGEKFTIECENAAVQVLGTKFNLISKPAETSVTLVEGKVKVFDFENIDTSVILHPDQKLTYIPDKRQVILTKANTNIETFWLQNKFVFNRFTLSEISQILKLYYGKTVIFDSTFYSKHKISGTAPTDDYRLIVEALAYITHSTYTIKGDTIYFKHQKF